MTCVAVSHRVKETVEETNTVMMSLAQGGSSVAEQAGGKFTPRSSGEADRHCHTKLVRLELQRKSFNGRLSMQYCLQYTLILISIQLYDRSYGPGRIKCQWYRMSQ